MKPPPFRTNPSTIARYFFHDCRRFFYFSSASPAQRKKEDIPTPDFDHSPLVAAILDSGHHWETEVVERLLAGRVVVADGPGGLHTPRLTPHQTPPHLKRQKPGRHPYHAPLVPPPPLYHRDRH